ncbi:MAG TPA: GH25 family lysozyme [Mycobacteriales bacterium]|nr:GH25 family lysozyme [Mycobacteriales bacterium]
MQRGLLRLRLSGRGLATTAVSVALLLGAAGLTPAGAQTTGTLRGPDVASYQHPGTSAHHCGAPINWTKVAKDDVAFAIVKATEGTTYLNPCFAEDYDGSLQAGLVHGAYHFARPATPVVSSAQQQADYFANAVGSLTEPDTLPPALDLEATGGLSRGALITWAQAFLLRLRHDTGRIPMIYTYPTFWNSTLGDPSAFAPFPLWMASYCHQTCAPPDALLYQYTPGGNINGISGHVDLSKFLGTSKQWAVVSDGTIASPWTAAPPSRPHGVHATAASAHSATVSWLPGNSGSSRVTKYTVTATPADPAAGDAAAATTKVAGSATTATVAGLEPGVSYTFAVTATNAAGTSPISNASAPVTIMIPTLLTPTVPDSITYGDPAAISATLTRTDTNQPLAGRHVVLSVRHHDATTWRQKAVLQTDSDGTVSTQLHPTRNLDIELTYRGSAKLQAATVVRTILVRPAVTAHLSRSSVKSGHLVLLSGRASPFVAGQTVRREGHYSGGWHLWDTSKLSKHGHYAFRIHPTVKVNVYRVVAVATHHRARGISPSRTVHAR